jgi:hypothetical protein
MGSLRNQQRIEADSNLAAGMHNCSSLYTHLDSYTQLDSKPSSRSPLSVCAEDRTSRRPSQVGHRRKDVTPQDTSLTDPEWNFVADLFERALALAALSIPSANKKIRPTVYLALPINLQLYL